MATITIDDINPAGDDINPAGAELFFDSESFMNELGDGELAHVKGGNSGVSIACTSGIAITHQLQEQQ